jgi:quercetin dioxygenase-like cupin family protein
MIDALVPFFVTDWAKIAETEHPGESCAAYWRTVQAGDTRVRMVRYSAGYRADHWCSRGHVVFVLEGELITEIQDGRAYTLSAGQSYQVSDGLAPHRSRSPRGAVLFIVDSMAPTSAEP